MEVKGTIKAIFAEQVISDKFRKREFVLTTNDKYPQDVLFQLTQGNTDLIDTIRVGEEVDVKFNLRGKEYINKDGKVSYFTSLECWQVSVQQGTPVAKPVTYADLSAPPETIDDTLPF